MAPDLPETIEKYFAAQNLHSVTAMVAAFAPDAQVRDEGRTYVGRKAIRDWKRKVGEKYGITVKPLTVERDGDRLTASVRVEGRFPGSPAELTYRFVLDGTGLIRALEIG